MAGAHAASSKFHVKEKSGFYTSHITGAITAFFFLRVLEHVALVLLQFH